MDVYTQPYSELAAIRVSYKDMAPNDVVVLDGYRLAIYQDYSTRLNKISEWCIRPDTDAETPAHSLDDIYVELKKLYKGMT